MNRSWPLLAPILSLILVLALPLAAFAAEDKIQFESRAEIEILQTLPDGGTVRVRQPAALVVPGSMVIYSNVMTNVGAEPAENLVVTNPIPEQMTYVSGSAFPETATVTFSVDGGQSFDAAGNLTLTDTDGKVRAATADDYTHIRWLLGEALLPGGIATVEYRAKLQ